MSGLLATFLLLACTSEEPAPPADAEELRDRVWTALRDDGHEVLHLQFSLPAIGGGFELDREVWVDWETDSIRRAYYGDGSDEAPLTLVIDDRRYYPPSPEAHPFDGELAGMVLEPIETLFLSLLFLRLTDNTAALTEAEVDGERVWRLEQNGVTLDVGEDENPCFDVRLDFDVKTSLPRASAAAACGDPLSDSRITAEWLDRDEIPEGYFAPETAADFEDTL